MAKVSVIIPTYNEKGSLGDCIESLGMQTVNDFEIVIVDDGSTDKTSEVLRNLQLTINNFQFFEQGHEGAGAARNLGVKHAKGKVLAFVDADMTFDKNFLKKLVEPIMSGKTKGTFSKEEYVSNWENVWARCWNINEGWGPKRRHPKNYPHHQPVFRAILKSEFDRVHGFTPGGYMDDWSLAEKLGYDAVNAPGAVFYHKNPDSLTEVFRQARWIGKRPYKFGPIGITLALIRSSLPVSAAIAVLKSVLFFESRFFIFKLTYDLGQFVGILESAGGKVSK